MQAFKGTSIAFTVKETIFTMNFSNNLRVWELNFPNKQIARVPLPRESVLLFQTFIDF